MMYSKAVGLTSVLCLLLPTVSQANNAVFNPLLHSSTPAKPDNYLGASIGQTQANGYCDEFAKCDDASKSWKAYMGVRFNENIVLETGYTKFGKQTAKDTNNKNFEQSASAFTTAAVAGYSVNQELELFGKAGIARWKSDQTLASGNTNDSGVDLLMGAGASYDLGNNIGVRAEWERYKDVGAPKVKQGDIDLLSVGVTFSSL